jgi:hypothetical protein
VRVCGENSKFQSRVEGGNMAAVQRNGRVAERMMILNEGTGALIARLGQVSAILSSQEGRKDLPWTDTKMKKVVACLQVPSLRNPFPSSASLPLAIGEVKTTAGAVTLRCASHLLAINAIRGAPAANAAMLQFPSIGRILPILRAASRTFLVSKTGGLNVLETLAASVERPDVYRQVVHTENSENSEHAAEKVSRVPEPVRGGEDARSGGAASQGQGNMRAGWLYPRSPPPARRPRR